jgi:hypothetical protein
MRILPSIGQTLLLFACIEASRLVRERLLLPEDADHYVAEAKSAAAVAFPQ